MQQILMSANAHKQATKGIHPQKCQIELYIYKQLQKSYKNKNKTTNKQIQILKQTKQNTQKQEIQQTTKQTNNNSYTHV